MKSLIAYMGFIMASGLLGVSGSSAADNTTTLLHPDRLKGLTEFKGVIASINQESRRITLTDASDQQVTVTVSSDTRVMDAENRAMSWVSLRTGDPIIAYYEPKERFALQIDRQKTIAESVLGV